MQAQPRIVQGDVITPQGDMVAPALNEREAYYSYLADLSRLERLSGGQVKISYAP